MSPIAEAMVRYAFSTNKLLDHMGMQSVLERAGKQIETGCIFDERHNKACDVMPNVVHAHTTRRKHMGWSALEDAQPSDTEYTTLGIMPMTNCCDLFAICTLVYITHL